LSPALRWRSRLANISLTSFFIDDLVRGLAPSAIQPRVRRHSGLAWLPVAHDEHECVNRPPRQGASRGYGMLCVPYTGTIAVDHPGHQPFQDIFVLDRVGGERGSDRVANPLLFV
jgi:hypothetical protein